VLKPFPAELEIERRRIEEVARQEGLDFFDTIFEMLDFDQINQIAAYGGFPQRYPHWRFGMEYEKLRKQHSYGLGKIYEMVINNDPCYAYLLNDNEFVDQKTVMAHVYGHCDFFKNNVWFSKTNRKMMDGMANHATRIHRHIDREGFETVEQFIDVCLSAGEPDRPLPAVHETRAGADEARDRAGGTHGGRPRAALPGEALHGPLHQPAGAAGRGAAGRAGEQDAARKSRVSGVATAGRAAIPAAARAAGGLAADVLGMCATRPTTSRRRA
jgi:hypothetical protein